MNVRVSRLLIGFALAASLALSGCSTIKKFTGQRDDTVLPGSREDVLPPQKIQAPEQEPAAKKSQCKADDPNCVTDGAADSIQ